MCIALGIPNGELLMALGFANVLGSSTCHWELRVELGTPKALGIQFPPGPADTFSGLCWSILRPSCVTSGSKLGLSAGPKTCFFLLEHAHFGFSAGFLRSRVNLDSCCFHLGAMLADLVATVRQFGSHIVALLEAQRLGFFPSGNIPRCCAGVSLRSESISEFIAS